jgi:hypothetical protein
MKAKDSEPRGGKHSSDATYTSSSISFPHNLKFAIFSKELFITCLFIKILSCSLVTRLVPSFLCVTKIYNYLNISGVQNLHKCNPADSWKR